jgi:homoserine O-acetyltransferase
MTDRFFRDGRYAEEGVTPAAGLAIARMMAHITYMSQEALDSKFGREPNHRRPDGAGIGPGFGVDFAVESYLDHQGQVFLERFDALSYLYLTRVMDYFDPFAAPGALEKVIARPVNWLVLSFETDWRFDTSHSRRIVRELEHVGQPVSFREISSSWGHDSFLLEIPEYHRTLRTFLDRALEEARR